LQICGRERGRKGHVSQAAKSLYLNSCLPEILYEMNFIHKEIFFMGIIAF
jgi:hypothetical protein